MIAAKSASNELAAARWGPVAAYRNGPLCLAAPLRLTSSMYHRFRSPHDCPEARLTRA